MLASATAMKQFCSLGAHSMEPANKVGYHCECEDGAVAFDLLKLLSIFNKTQCSIQM